MRDGSSGLGVARRRAGRAHRTRARGRPADRAGTEQRDIATRCHQREDSPRPTWPRAHQAGRQGQDSARHLRYKHGLVRLSVRAATDSWSRSVGLWWRSRRAIVAADPGMRCGTPGCTRLSGVVPGGVDARPLARPAHCLRAPCCSSSCSHMDTAPLRLRSLRALCYQAVVVLRVARAGSGSRFVALIALARRRPRPPGGPRPGLTSMAIGIVCRRPTCRDRDRRRATPQHARPDRLQGDQRAPQGVAGEVAELAALDERDRWRASCTTRLADVFSILTPATARLLLARRGPSQRAEARLESLTQSALGQIRTLIADCAPRAPRRRTLAPRLRSRPRLLRRLTLDTSCARCAAEARASR